MPTSREYPVVVVGAGPAGLSAAVTAAGHGLRVAVLDQQPREGGAFYRHSAAHGRAADPAALHHDWEIFQQLQRLFRSYVASERIVQLPSHTVWSVEDGFTIHAQKGERARVPVSLTASALVVAAGAYDRVVPFPGWTLPGVLAAGGAQALLKGSLVAVPGPVVVAGTGPLLLVVASGLLEVGVEVAAVVEENHPTRYALRPSGWAGALGRGSEAAAYVAALTRHRVPYLAGARVVEARGDDAVESVQVRTWRGVLRTYGCRSLLVNHGFSPQPDLALSLGADWRVDADGSVVVEVDDGGRTSVPGLYAAGEVTGVGGARLAMLEGRLVGDALAGRRPDPVVVRRVGVHRRFAAAMHAVHRPAPPDLPDDTVVCRCEEVTAGDVREAVELGAGDVRTVKLLSRAGMGLCQGRVCARTVADLVGAPPEPARRVLADPVPLSTLARLDPS